MKNTRREFIKKLVGTIGAVGIIVVFPSEARACLYGTWHVQCPRGHIDTVTDGTCQHRCEKCGLQVFSGNVVTVVCRNGHANRITTAPVTATMLPSILHAPPATQIVAWAKERSHLGSDDQ